MPRLLPSWCSFTLKAPELKSLMNDQLQLLRYPQAQKHLTKSHRSDSISSDSTVSESELASVDGRIWDEDIDTRSSMVERQPPSPIVFQSEAAFDKEYLPPHSPMSVRLPNMFYPPMSPIHK
ncbi:hypothetical protein THRCLA_21633 [Thraustotheca clavata]|uniref:Uncharacterized protein n=1 Tax=Thraustotheca clavata TaxID=74557 RepID=A0A1V9ZSY8_9STRA|nr:hypothetical protein THRCLA_21633 [Thraustotheca clavata]